MRFFAHEHETQNKSGGANMAKVQSVEPNIADLANGWLKSYKLPYKLEQESIIESDAKSEAIP